MNQKIGLSCLQKKGSTKLALHLTEKRTEDRIQAEHIAAATKIRTILLGFNVSDLENVCRDLENKGVKLYKRLKEESFGKHAIIEDILPLNQDNYTFDPSLA